MGTSSWEFLWGVSFKYSSRFSYSSEDGNEYIHKNIDENEIFSIATFEENFQVIVNGNIDDCITDNALDLALYVPSILNSDEEDGRSGEEEDDLLSVANFPNFVLQQEVFPNSDSEVDNHYTLNAFGTNPNVFNSDDYDTGVVSNLFEGHIVDNNM